MKKMNTPWGVANAVLAYDPDRTVVHVHTESHGGIGVAVSRQMPALFARLGEPEGDWLWYEQDISWAIPVTWAPQYFSAATLDCAKKTLRDEFPELYMQHYGEVLTAATSRALEERQWLANSADSFVICHGYDDSYWNVPTGYVYAAGWRRRDEAVAGFLLPADDYAKRPGRIILDSYPRWEPDRSLPQFKQNAGTAVTA